MMTETDRMDAPSAKRDLHPLFIVVVLLAGFFLRTIDIGAAPLIGDEVSLSYLAFNFGHNGQRAELGIPSSAGVNQPPFFHDVFAIPFAFDPDPRMARLFMAGLHLVSMAVLYFIVNRYWGARTALAALILYAVMPRAVIASRFLWNAYLTLPFLIGYLATGFLLAEGKRWARWLHLPMLACAIGAHIIAFVIGPLSLGFLVRDWIKGRKHRQLIVDHAIGVAIAILILVPWAIGALHQQASTPGAASYVQRPKTSLEELVSDVVSVPTYLDAGLLSIPDTAYADPPAPLATVYQIIGWFTLLAALFITGRAIRRRRYPDLMIGLAFLVPPVVLFFSPTHTFIHYLMSLLPGTAIILAIILIDFRPLRATVAFRWLGALMVALICALDLVLVVNVLQQIHGFPHDNANAMTPVQDLIRLRDEAARPGVETIYLLQGTTGRDYERVLAWTILAVKGPSRLIWGDNFALPVRAGGATYVSYGDKPLIPELYGTRTPRLTLDGLYRAVDVPPGSGFAPSCRPEGVTGLSNGVTILGYYTPDAPLPRPGQPWTIYVLWRGRTNSQHTSYQMFNHLVDAKGDRYAQNDIPTLATDLWRDGDLLVSKAVLTASDGLPVDSPLTLRVGMYTLPTSENPNIVGVGAVDENGKPGGGWVSIPVCQQ